MKKQRCKVLVTGNARSGTTWFCKVLRKAGLDVRHEYMGSDGTVSCFFFKRTPRYPFTPSAPPAGKISHQGERHEDYKFDVKIHLVRNPLKSIGSIWGTMFTAYWDWHEEFKVIPKDLKPKFRKSMHAWHNVNLGCEKICKHRIRLEDISKGKGWKDICKWLNLPEQPMPVVPAMNKSHPHGMFPARKVTWKDMRKCDTEMAAKIAKMAIRYGYSDTRNVK